MMFDTCPKQLWFKYELWMPQDDHDYFQYWKDVEELLVSLLENKKPKKYSPEVTRLANAMYSHEEFRKIIEWKKLKYQTKYENENVLWFSDIETDDVIIDVKTSSQKWNEETIQKYKFQAKIYLKYSWKKIFYFLIWNKKTYEVQWIKVTTNDFSDLEKKISEVKQAFEIWYFPARPAFHCKFCDYNNFCNKE